MSTQLSIDYDSRLSVEAQLGMAQADANADERWKRVIEGAILAVARSRPEFTVDDVLAELEKIPNAPATHNLSALGPRMVRVSKELKYMRSTGHTRRSIRPKKHGNRHTVWESLVYRGD